MVNTSPAPWANSMKSRRDDITSQREKDMQIIAKQKENARLYKESILECHDLEEQLIVKQKEADQLGIAFPSPIPEMFEHACEKKLELSKQLPGMVRIQVEQEVESE